MSVSKTELHQGESVDAVLTITNNSADIVYYHRAYYFVGGFARDGVLVGGYDDSLKRTQLSELRRLFPLQSESRSFIWDTKYCEPGEALHEGPRPPLPPGRYELVAPVHHPPSNTADTHDAGNVWYLTKPVFVTVVP
jgi:hypothetical protein